MQPRDLNKRANEPTDPATYLSAPLPTYLLSPYTTARRNHLHLPDQPTKRNTKQQTQQPSERTTNRTNATRKQTTDQPMNHQQADQTNNQQAKPNQSKQPFNIATSTVEPTSPPTNEKMEQTNRIDHIDKPINRPTDRPSNQASKRKRKQTHEQASKQNNRQCISQIT